MKSFTTKSAAGGAALFASAALVVSVLPGAAQASDATSDRHGATVTRADLDPLNNSGAMGHAKVRSHGRMIKVDVHAHGLTKGVPHAQHIHYGEAARNECPSVALDDTNRDFRLETLEGAPAYGPVRVSLTKRGDTSPDSVLAIDRYPTAPKGSVDYDRRTRVGKGVARAIRQGEAVVVIHGVDYNGNGTYDVDGAGTSDLDPTLPAEATDPALCGVLRK